MSSAPRARSQMSRGVSREALLAITVAAYAIVFVTFPHLSLPLGFAIVVVFFNPWDGALWRTAGTLVALSIMGVVGVVLSVTVFRLAASERWRRGAALLASALFVSSACLAVALSNARFFSLTSAAPLAVAVAILWSRDLKQPR